jgi:hypothetical protein
MSWKEILSMLRRLPVFLLLCITTGRLHAQDLAGVEIHGFVTQGVLFSSHNNYLTMQSSSGSLQWTDGAVSVSDSVTDNLRVGIQLHMYQLGELGGPNIRVDWASGEYKVNDHLGFRAGKVKTVMGLFNDFQDVDSVFLWALLPESVYPVDNASYFLAHIGGDVYGDVPLGERAGTLHYDGYAGESNLDLNGGYIKQLADVGLVFTTAPGGKTYGGDVRWATPLRGLMFGSSAAAEALNGTAPGGSIGMPGFVFTAQYVQFKRGKYYLAAEYDREPVKEVLVLGTTVIPISAAANPWYIMGSYQLAKKIQVGAYYSTYVTRGQDASQAADYSKDWVASSRYDFNSYFYGKLEGHFLRGTALGYYESTNPTGLKPNSNMLAAKIGFSF